MSTLRLVPTNQELTASHLELIRAIGSDGHYNPVNQTFRLKTLPIRLRRFFDILGVCEFAHEGEVSTVFHCKATTSLDFSPTIDIPNDKRPTDLNQVLNKYFILDSSLSNPYDCRLVYSKGSLDPLAEEDRWILTSLEPFGCSLCHSDRELTSSYRPLSVRYRLDWYKAYYILRQSENYCTKAKDTAATSATLSTLVYQ